VTMRTTLSTILFCASLLLGAGVARADLVTLADGRPLQGEVVTATEDELRFRIFGGGEVILRWGDLIARDEERLKRELGFIAEDEGEVTVPGVRVTLLDGNVYDGVPLEARREGVLSLKVATGPIEIPESRVRSVEEIGVAALDAYTPRELYDRYVREHVPQGGPEHFETVQYCRRIGDYEKALEHLALIEESHPDFQPEAVQLQKSAVSVLLEQKEALELFDELRLAASRSRYDDALAALTRLESRFPESPILETVRRRRLDREHLEERQREQDRERVTGRYYYWMRELARQKVREEELTLAEVRSYAEREFANDIAAQVAESENLEVDEVKELFAARETRFKRRATYGDGTYLVEERKKSRRPERRGRSDRRDPRRRDPRRGPERTIEYKPPTPDEWWAKAGPVARRDWLLAYYAEHSSDVDVLRTDHKSCVRCGGTGRLRLLGTSGGATEVPCDRCWGLGKDKIVVFQ